MSQQEHPQSKGQLPKLEPSSYSARQPNSSLRHNDLEMGGLLRSFLALGDILELGRKDIVTEVSKEHPESIRQLSRELLRGVRNWKHHYESLGVDDQLFRDQVLTDLTGSIKEILNRTEHLMLPNSESKVIKSAALHENLLGIVEAGIRQIKIFAEERT